MKKAIFLLAVIVAFFACCSLTVSAADEEKVFAPYYEPFKYAANGNPTQNFEDQVSQYADTDALKSLLLSAISKCEKSVDVSKLKIPYEADVYAAIAEYLFYAEPMAFNVTRVNCSYQSQARCFETFSFEYRAFADTQEEYKVCKSDIELAADMLLKDIEGNDNLSELEKALLVHDRLAVWTQYSEGASWPDDAHTMYGVLGKRSGVCQGYTMAYMYMLNRLGIKNYFCESQAMRHCWNIVYIKGEPYHVDVTWDDLAWEAYASGVQGGVSHDNFLRSTDGIKATGHTANDFDTTPKTTTFDKYFWQSSRTAFQLIDDELYYIDNGFEEGEPAFDVGVLCRYSDKKELLFIDDIWNHNAFSDWPGNFSCLSSDGEVLFYSDASSIYEFDIKTFAYEKIYTPKLDEFDNIFGFRYECGYFFLDINNKVPGENSTKGLARQKFEYNLENTKAHLFDAVCDEKCNYCGVTREAEHSFGYACDTSCDVCGITRKATEHEYSSKTDERCDVCGKKRTIVKITSQPKTAYAQKNKMATATVKAKGDGLKYEWYVCNSGASKYKKTKVTTSKYNLKMTDKNTGCKVYCVVSDKYGNKIRTNTVSLRMSATITKQPAKVTYVKSGSKATITVGAAGSGLKYTWYVCDAGDKEYTKAKTTSSTYTLKMTKNNSNRKVYCVVSDKYGKKVYTNTVRLRIKASISAQPKTAYAKKGEKAYVSVKATGEGLRYAWYVCDEGRSGFTKTSNTASTYSVKITDRNSNRRVYCIISDKYGNKIRTATVRVRMKLTLTKQPKSVAVAKNKTAKISLKASGEGLRYTWYYKDKGSKKYVKASTKTNSFSCKMLTKRSGRRVYCVIKDRFGKTVKSKTVILKVK